MKAKGLVLINTGPGKGKTTAALGLALRAWGQGLKVGIIQFIKSKDRDYGELKAFQMIGQGIDVFTLGSGFVNYGKGPNSESNHKEVAQRAFQLAQEKIFQGDYDMIVLDEINYAMGMELISVNQVEEVVRKKPGDLHLILTGRNAPPEIINIADSVTYMEEVKHHYKAGIRAQKGIEF